MTILVPVETSEDVHDVIHRALAYNTRHREEVFGDDPSATFTQDTLKTYSEFDNFALIRDANTDRWYVGLGCHGPLDTFLEVFPTGLDFVTGTVIPSEICGPHPALFENDSTGKLRWSKVAVDENYVLREEKVSFG